MDTPRSRDGSFRRRGRAAATILVPMVTAPRPNPRTHGGGRRRDEGRVSSPPDEVLWPERLIELARSVRREDASARAREDLWVLVGVVLRRRVRAAARRFGGLPAPEIEDVVSDKLLDLLRRFDTTGWAPERSHPGEVVNFLDTVARNAVVDVIRRLARRTPIPEEAIDLAFATPDPTFAREPESPESRVERSRFVGSLIECAGRLPARDRTIWTMRVLLELSSREIAEHPDVRLRPDHIDVILQRCRERVKACMGERGRDWTDLPRGTFLALWESTRANGRELES